MTKKPGNLVGVWAMAGTAFLWSIAGLFIKVIDWNPFAIAGIRSLIASLVILLYLKRPKLHLSFPQVAAGVANAVTMLLFVAANKTTTAANAILLQYIAPVVTAILSAFLLKERARIEQWIAFLIITFGMVIMFSEDLGGGHLLGNVLAALSGITFSFYFVMMRKQKDGSPLESALISHWLAAFIGILIALFAPMPTFSAKSIMAIIILGTLQVGLSAILFSVAIKRISAVSASLISVIEPVFNPVWVFLALGEAPGFNSLVGGLIIVAAVTGASLISARPNHRLS